MWIVRFEFVSPHTHAQYYKNEAPLCTPDHVPEEHWTAVAVMHGKHDRAVGHFRGLKELCRAGELIRRVKIRPIVDVDWHETPSPTSLLGQDLTHQEDREGRQAAQQSPNHAERRWDQPAR